MIHEKNKRLILEDGSYYDGFSFGAKTERISLIVFNTSMVGYQEIMSDPSYTDQFVVMTYPLIGNCGVAEDDFESKNPTIGGLIVKEYNEIPSNFRYTKTLAEIMEECDIPGIYGIDTRKLAKSIRDKGSRKALITSIDTSVEEGLEYMKNTEIPTDAVPRVSTDKVWYSPTGNSKFNVVAFDCGIKLNIIRMLNKRGCNVAVVPYDTNLETVEKMRPDGIFFSNGPGDPEDMTTTINLINEVKGKYPIFGICLGHQLISLSYGGSTYKLKFGHRGGNYPVKNLNTGKIEITSQNHNYAVSADSLEGTPLSISHINALDGTVEGLQNMEDKIFSVQYHPESAPGPQDSGYLFDQFVSLMKEAKKYGNK